MRKLVATLVLVLVFVLGFHRGRQQDGPPRDELRVLGQASEDAPAPVGPIDPGPVIEILWRQLNTLHQETAKCYTGTELLRRVRMNEAAAVLELDEALETGLQIEDHSAFLAERIESLERLQLLLRKLNGRLLRRGRRLSLAMEPYVELLTVWRAQQDLCAPDYLDAEMLLATVGSTRFEVEQTMYLMFSEQLFLRDQKAFLELLHHLLYNELESV